jgi:hypothetical protein
MTASLNSIICTMAEILLPLVLSGLRFFDLHLLFEQPLALLPVIDAESSSQSTSQ